MTRMLALFLILATACGWSAARAGGICDANCLAGPRAAATPPAATGGWPGGTVGSDQGSVARGYYDESLTEMWKADANGTCLGVLGNWKLTPKYIIAEGTAYELLAFAGSPARIDVTARRLLDYATATFTLTPVSSKRLDVVGDVAADLTHYNASLQRC